MDELAVRMGCTAELMPDAAFVISDETVWAEIEKLGDLEAVDRDGRTPLMNAACYERTALVKKLIEAGACVNTADRMGATALHTAVQQGNIALTKMLLESGADVNARDSFGNNPLQWAKHFAPSELFALLLSYGADPRMKNDYGVSAMDSFAAYPDVMSILTENKKP